MKLSRNLYVKILISPISYIKHFKHILQRDAPSLQVLRAYSLAPSLDTPADAD